MIKKIIINFAIVAAGLFCLDFSIGEALRYFYFQENSGLHFRTTYAMEKTKAEILVFGSSSANHHYVPEVFEDSLRLSFYNTGRDGNFIFYQTAVLKSVLKRYTPNIIILDYVGTFAKEGSAYDRLSTLLPYYKSHKEIRNIIELKSPFEKIKLISKIYPFNSQILTIAMGNLGINRNRKPDNKGYVALYKEWNLEINNVANLSAYPVDSIKVSSFTEFLTLAQESGARVYVIYSPIYLKYDKRQEVDICKEICSLKNVPFWDFSKDTLFLNSRYLFQDIEHLNHRGAIIFSNLVARKIKLDL